MTNFLVDKAQNTTALPVTIFLFETFQVSVANQPEHKFRTNKSRALLAYLLLAGGQPVLRTTLTDLLWPDYLVASARASLRQAVTDLRKLFAGFELINADYHRVQLHIDPALLLCDALRFDELLTACTQHPHSTVRDCPSCQRRLHEAVALYKGDFLADLPTTDSEPFNRWREEQRTRYAARLAQWQPLLNHTVSEPDKPLGNLPTPLTPLIGRGEALHDLAQKLHHPVYRCLTLVGPGGIGKTRLALAVGAEEVTTFPDGVWFVDLGALAHATPLTGSASQAAAQTTAQGEAGSTTAQTQIHDRLASAILGALGLSLQGATHPTAQLQTYLQEKRALLILDNFEHLSAGAAYLSQLLQAAPKVRLLITSRHRLALQGQQLYNVPGLAWPATEAMAATPTAHLVEQYPSLALFLERATLTGVVLTPDEATLATVAEICELVEGAPLALELAAALLESHTLDEIAGLIRASYQVLAGLFYDLPPRQRSAQAMLQTAWQLLTSAEAQILACCSVFQGGFTLDAAQSVIDATETDLEHLLHKSLLQQQGSGRYRMHELVRQFAAEQLKQVQVGAQAAAQAIYDRHAAYYLSLVAGWQPADAAERRFRAAVQVDLENVETAWQWALAAGQVERLFTAVEGLIEFYEMTGAFYAAEALLRQSIEQVRVLLTDDKVAVDAAPSTGAGTKLLASLLMQAGYVYTIGLAQHAAAEVAATEALALAEALQETKLIIRSYHGLAAVAYATGNFAHGQALGERALQVVQGHALDRDIAMCLSVIGITAFARTDYGIAEQYLQEALAWAEAAQDSRKALLFRNQLGMLYRHQGDFGEALRYFEQTLPATLEQDDTYNIAVTVANLGLLHVLLGNYPTSVAWLTEAYQRCDAYGDRRTTLELRAILGYSLVQQGDFPAGEAHCRRVLADPPISISALQICHLALGELYMVQGAWSAAEEAYTQLAADSREPEAPGILLLAEVGLAVLHLAQGDPGAALAALEPLLSRFDPVHFDTFFTAARFLLAAYKILAANDDPRATAILTQAWQIVTDFAAKISDPTLRHAYLTNVPVHRELGQLIGE
jgi:predicted ATPase/DNA-binding SARP family transcriptional activator